MTIKRLLIIALIALVADQVSKEIVQRLLSYGSQISVVPGFFDLTLTYNKGVAFGFMSDWSELNRNLSVYFSTIFAMAVLLFLYFRYYAYSLTQTNAIALVLGGALGNLVDRVRHGQVVDFLDFHIVSYHWPAFNLADSFICMGVFILLIVKD